MQKINLILGGTLLLFLGDLFSQEITRETYIDYLPLVQPRIISQTNASAEFALYGHPADDRNPVDGIADQRFKRLFALAERFAPILFLNTKYSRPLDFLAVLRYQGSSQLHVDTWDLGQATPRLIEGERFAFGSPDIPHDPERLFADFAPRSPFDGIENKADSRLLELVREFNPYRPRPAYTPVESDRLRVLYFDTPGRDEASWKKAYKNEISGNLPKMLQTAAKVYAHPFIHEALPQEVKHRFEFVIQYWFFYPFNDGGNNHEGDWEHINVRITRLGREAGLLDKDDVMSILNGKDSVLDSLVIGKVDYYFHNFVMVLDYTDPSVYEPANEVEWKALNEVRAQERIGQRWLWQQTRKRAILHGQINTHPIAYIGADNKGTDQLLTMPGGKNRDSHGTYPFPGIFKGIGPLGASEQINGNIDFTKDLEKKPERVLQYGVGGPNSYDIELVPDWECVIDLVCDPREVEARSKWSWLVLPIRWGFPASPSPAAGFVRHADTGNLGPVGPAYNPAWNRVGASRGYQAYVPHKFSSEFPLGWQDNFKNNWGILNLTIPTLISLPPYNLFWMVPFSPVRALWERKNALFYSQETVPFRRVAINLGYYPFIGDDDFARLLFDVDSDVVERFQVDNNAQVDRNSLRNFDTFDTRNFGFELNYHVGKHFAAENLFRYSLSRVAYDLVSTEKRPLSPENRVLGVVQGDLQMIEYSGSLRHSFMTNSFQPFIKVGYGYSYYRVRNIELNGRPLEQSKTQWFHNNRFFPPWPPKNLLPNTWHVGAGFEFIFNRNFSESEFWPPFMFWKWKYGTPDLGFRIEYALYFHELGDDAQPNGAFITRHLVNLKFTVSF